MASTDLERRAFMSADLRVEGEEEGAPFIRGHAAVFNQLSEDLGGFRERIAPGAFSRAISEQDDVRALLNHDSNYVLGRTTAKTLRLREDDQGLAVRILAPQTQTIRDLVVEPMKRGDITQMSFAFRVRLDGEQWDVDDGGVYIRTITDVRLYDVSVVTYPAYPQTDASLAKRSLAEHLDEMRKQDSWRVDYNRRRLDLAALR